MLKTFRALKKNRKNILISQTYSIKLNFFQNKSDQTIAEIIQLKKLRDALQGRRIAIFIYFVSILCLSYIYPFSIYYITNLSYQISLLSLYYFYPNFITISILSLSFLYPISISSLSNLYPISFLSKSYLIYILSQSYPITHEFFTFDFCTFDFHLWLCHS